MDISSTLAAGFSSFPFPPFLIENKHLRIHGYYYHVHSAPTKNYEI